MIEKWIEIAFTHSYQLWVGLCVFVLIFGFALCAYNVRRQLILGFVIVVWSVNIYFNDAFYSSPAARYLWFPYWVLLQSSLIVLIFYIETLTTKVVDRFNLVSKKVLPAELRQEIVVASAAFVLVVLDIAQLASALAGNGRLTSGVYDDGCRLMYSVIVIALVLPGKSGLIAIKDALSEKVVQLVASRNYSNRHID